MLLGSQSMQRESYLGQVTRVLKTVKNGLKDGQIDRQELEARCLRLDEQLTQILGQHRAARATR